MNKFRVYDPTTGKMYYSPNEHIYLNIDGTCVNFQNGEVLEVMLAIGKHDKNGDDIYDQDFVENSGKYLIQWLDKEARFHVHRLEDFQDFEWYKGKVVELCEYKIIGNSKQHKIEDFK